MKKKTRTSVKSQTPISIAADLLPEVKAISKKNRPTNKIGPVNGKNGKHKEKIVTNGIDHNALDAYELLRALSEVKSGNFSVRMPIDKAGIAGKICDTLNDIIILNEILVEELTVARNTIGKQGRLNHRVV